MESSKPHRKLQEKVVSPENYVLKMAGSSSGKIGIALSNNVCELYSYDSSSLRKHSKLPTDKSHTISELKFSPIDDNLLYVGLANGSIETWDIRTDGRLSQTYEENPDTKESTKPILSFDVSPSGKVLCAGTELVQNDAFMLFWDVRGKDMLGGYWNSHTDDIVQVKFSDAKSNRLISGSEDGLVNVFDIGEPTEDDALQYSLNVDCAVNKLAWLSNTEIACLTQNVDLQIWNVETADQIKSYTRKDIAKPIKNVSEEHCDVVDIYRSNSNGVLLFVGSHETDESLNMLRQSEEKLCIESTFEQYNQVLRCSWWDKKANLLIAGGEEGKVSIWNFTMEDESIESEKRRSLPSAMKKMKLHRKKPY